MVLSCSFILLSLGILKLARAENFSLYVRNNVNQTVISSISSNYSRIGSTSSNASFTFSAFQNVIVFSDTAAYDLDINVTRRTNRHIVFCIVNQSNPKNATNTPLADSQSRLDYITLPCDVVNTQATLFLSNRTWIRKPEGN